MKPARSLKSRALQWLAQREHSRVELQRKLLPHARAEDAAAAVARPDGSEAPELAAAAAQRVDTLLDWLQTHAYLSPERFIESRVHARAARFGNLRIRGELRQHELTLPLETLQALQAGELERARQLCARKFDAVVPAPGERAKRARFLAGRGFSPETIHRLLRGLPLPDDTGGG